MEIDVNISKSRTTEPLMTISAGSYCTNTSSTNSNNNNSNNNNNNNNNNNATIQCNTTASTSTIAPIATTPIAKRRTGCCGIFSRLLCVTRSSGKTASSSTDYNNLTNSASCVNILAPATGKTQTHRRTPQEIYLESRGKSCKKLLKFNGHSNKILLYPEEGWARTASSSYWTITPCWWQPNRCRIEEFSGTQRHATKAKMLPLEQKGSLLIAGHFTNKKSSATNNSASIYSIADRYGTMQIGDGTTPRKEKSTTSDEFKLYLSSNISMEDYNMGYCLTGFVERRCQQTNSFQMTHFAVIKRQWPSLGNSSNDAKST